MDYVQLVFDGPVLTAYTWPTLALGDRACNLGDSGYRDELCARIASRVVTGTVDENQIAITFFDGATVRVALDASPQAAQLAGTQLVVF